MYAESNASCRPRETEYVFIVGVVDRLGYLKCGRCVDVTDYDDGYVWSDAPPHNSEPCDACGRPLNHNRGEAW